MSFAQFIAVMLIGLNPLAMAQDQAKAGLTFQEWKDQQILDSQNQVLRANTRIASVKGKKGADGSGGLADQKVPAGRIKKVNDSDALALFDKELRRAQESLDANKGLTLTDYINIYLPSLQDQPEAVNALALKLSKEELAELFKGLVLKGPAKPDDAKRNSATSMLGGSSLATVKNR